MTYARRITEYPPTHPSAGRLGRHVRHDPRSLAYRYPARSLGTLKSVRHHRYVPVLDQGDIWACTGFAALGAVGTAQLFEALAKNTLQPSATDAAEDAQRAYGLYSAATKVDEFDGEWPPDDTGSSGLAVAKAAKTLGLISGYRHATSLEAALAALADQPVIAGINWYSSFDQAGINGLISIEDDAVVRGGHEICLDELDVERKQIGFTNSWGTGWGDGGRGYLRWDDFGRLLSEDGDVTVFVPATQPPPTPDPDPSGELAGCLSAIIKAARRGQQILKGK